LRPVAEILPVKVDDRHRQVGLVPIGARDPFPVVELGVGGLEGLEIQNGIMKPTNGKHPIKEREHWRHLMDSAVWIKFYYRDDDIVINASTKSGTTWVQQIATQLIWMGAEHINVSEESPWLRL
jgi:hypothetical protein